MLTEKENSTLEMYIEGDIIDEMRLNTPELRKLSKASGRVNLPEGVSMSRVLYANLLLEERKIKQAERQMPVVASAVEKRVKEIFRGVDLSKSGRIRKGKIDYEISEKEDERRAIAVINGNEVARLSLWKNPAIDSYNQATKIYSLSGNIGNQRVRLSYSEECRDYKTGEVYEARLYGKVTELDDSTLVVNEARSILKIAKSFNLLS